MTMMDMVLGALIMFVPYFFMLGLPLFREQDDAFSVWIIPTVIAWLFAAIIIGVIYSWRMGL